MITNLELNSYLQNFLAVANFDDYAPNGMQIEGKFEIRRICTAVTASLDVIREAVAKQADALLVHHGYFWRGENPVICGMKYQRIANLIEHHISLFAYHLPLDCHPTLGNNACLAKMFNLTDIKMHKVGKIANLLWSGKLTEPLTAKFFTEQLKLKLGREPIHIGNPDSLIKSIALCSGAAQDYIEDAKALGVDAYLSGEISERTFYQAEELGINYFSGGHHATERYGIQELGQHLANQFGLWHHFIDSANPI